MMSLPSSESSQNVLKAVASSNFRLAADASLEAVVVVVTVDGGADSVVAFARPLHWAGVWMHHLT